MGPRCLSWVPFRYRQDDHPSLRRFGLTALRPNRRRELGVDQFMHRLLRKPPEQVSAVALTQTGDEVSRPGILFTGHRVVFLRVSAFAGLTKGHAMAHPAGGPAVHTTSRDTCDLQFHGLPGWEGCRRRSRVGRRGLRLVGIGRLHAGSASASNEHLELHADSLQDCDDAFLVSIVGCHLRAGCAGRRVFKRRVR